MTLKQHKCSHATSYAYICDVCGKSFKVRNQLRHHRKDHEVEFRWPCQYCEEKFKSCDTYKNHIAKTHPDKVKDVENGSNMKFYPCTHCTRILINIEDLREHMNVHTGNKPHKCRFCGKGFSSRKNMRQHEKSHTGEQNLRCHLCPKKYSDPTAMQAHMMRVHHLEINPEVLAEKRVVKNIVSSGPKVSVVAEGDSAVITSEKVNFYSTSEKVNFRMAKKAQWSFRFVQWSKCNRYLKCISWQICGVYSKLYQQLMLACGHDIIAMPVAYQEGLSRYFPNFSMGTCSCLNYLAHAVLTGHKLKNFTS